MIDLDFAGLRSKEKVTALCDEGIHVDAGVSKSTYFCNCFMTNNDF